jgi:hypothetical protein
MRKHEHVDLFINIALGVVLIVSGCTAIVAMVAVINGVVSLIGHLA